MTDALTEALAIVRKIPRSAKWSINYENSVVKIIATALAAKDAELANSEKMIVHLQNEIVRLKKRAEAQLAEKGATRNDRIEGAVRGLERLKSDFAMKGANATTIERAIHTLRTFARPAEQAVTSFMRNCATDGCDKKASVHFERGGVGSDYCHDCYMRVQALAQEKSR